MKIIQINSEAIKSWIQTIASIIAIVGAIVAFYKAFDNDRVLQSQIENLQTIASESKIQTELLKAERDSMSIRWKQQIKPVFEIQCDFHSGGTNEIDALLVNNGKIATDIKVIDNNSFFNVDIPFKNLGEGMKKTIYLNFKDKNITVPEDVDLEITISFKDASGTSCYQKIKIQKFVQSIEKRMRGIA
jgi:hypothetical protein